MVTPDDFAFLSEFLKRRSGLLLPSHKAHLIEVRLAPIARRFGFRDVNSLVRDLRYARETLARAVTEAMTTNDSAFFRDRAVFQQFRNLVLPRLLLARADNRRLRIWCAACAAGQEAYSVAMILEELKLAAQGWSLDVIATDISSDSIARAEEGVYTQFELQRGMTAELLKTYFVQEGTTFRIADPLRRMVSFRTFNLLDSFGWLYDIDVVFLRNVLIYLDDRTKRQLLEKTEDVLSPDGFLVLGHAETAKDFSANFAPVNGAADFNARRNPSSSLLSAVG